jgi:hypothetical protein
MDRRRIHPAATTSSPGRRKSLGSFCGAVALKVAGGPRGSRRSNDIDASAFRCASSESSRSVAGIRLTGHECGSEARLARNMEMTERNSAHDDDDAGTDREHHRLPGATGERLHPSPSLTGLLRTEPSSSSALIIGWSGDHLLAIQAAGHHGPGTAEQKKESR